ncbi:PBSX family phage terminase large subunit [Lactobacillus johnsonii]|uniref:Terminase n=1 Tax=Lactobacillus johnsonii TaxID=33959 RepID=A0A9X6NZP3_LACJH|nr:PBSX family phage terminase large subunit [Lactobacillus johnsonii]OYS01782.1 terminase [Lactobacillus johnsonii]OYS07096.1 terminase [Lactobacillus johnsonii]OYS07705.1 terminase [Lactobacillus johnsonii]OYS09645.1 terminase [Lactobacillus johnsonii]OYS14565.1 terminase [Lactobacillus johnsonii]
MAIIDFFTKKQIEVFHFYRTQPFKIMILSGAVRSGKTFIDNVLFINELKRVSLQAKKDGNNHPRFILAGASSGSIYNNVISELQTQFGITLNPDKHNHYHLFGVDIVPVYTGSIGGLKSARGFTAYGAYVNEASLANEAVFNEIQNRCSKSGAHIICDTNPDIPTHWLKTNYIDNDNPDAGFVSFNFTIDDNTTLDSGYVKSIKASKTGVFYDRDILGLWATGDGIVYQDFNKDTMVVDEVPDNLEYYCGVDWGFAKGHENVITVMGDDPDTDISYLIGVYQSTGKYIDYWVDIAHQIQDKRGYGINFWCDSARPEYVSYFQQQDIQARNADKSVMDGIEYCSSRIKLGKFKVLRNCAEPFLDDLYQYVWDPVKGVPKKEHDNVMDSFRYGLYNQHKQLDNEFIPNIYI